MPFSLLSPQEVEALHLATLRILDETGILLNEPHSRRMLAEAGARLGDGRVFIPPELVERCVAQAGKQVTIRGRGGSSKTLGDGRLYFHNLGGARDIYDAGSRDAPPGRCPGCP